MSKPQVIVVPPNAGIGTVPPVQVPLINDTAVTLINQDNYLGLILCNDDHFNPTSVWPLPPSTAAPQPGINNLWIQNPNNKQIQVLVVQGIVPMELVSSNGYLPTGTPIQYAGQVQVFSYGGTYTLTLPIGVKGLAIIGNAGISGTPTIAVTGLQSKITYLDTIFNYTTWASCQLTPELDTSIEVIITLPVLGTGEIYYFYWLYSIDDLGQWTISADPSSTPPVNYGKNEVITNTVVPIAIRTRSEQYYVGTASAVAAGTLPLNTTYNVQNEYMELWRIVINIQGTGTLEAKVTDDNGYTVCDFMCTGFGTYSENLAGFLVLMGAGSSTLNLVTSGTITSCEATLYYTAINTL